MSSLLIIILIGISLSMDAFSLSIIYGMIGLNKKQKILISIIVGIYHFIMPIIGFTIGNYIDSIAFINLDIIAAIILIYLGIDLIISELKQVPNLKITTSGFLLFGLSVSIDSLSVGIGTKSITDNYLLSPLVFSICSFIFTYTGLFLGNIIGKKVGEYSKIIGGIILLIIAILLFIY